MKVTGRTRSAKALGGQLDYLTRGGRLAAELPNGAQVLGRPGLRDLRDRWLQDTRVLSRSASCPTQSLGVVLSMPAGTPLETVGAAARTWARGHLAPSADYLLVEHRDRGHPHVHVAVRAVQSDGHRLRATPADLQAWREAFAVSLRAEGIEALATPRREKVQRLLAAERAPERPLEQKPEPPRPRRSR